MSYMKKSRKNMSLKKKIKILDEISRGTSMTSISKRENIPLSTISTWNLKKDNIVSDHLSRPASFTKKRASPYEIIDNELLTWFQVQRSRSIPISGQVLIQKADDIARAKGIDNFICSSTWISRFKTRHTLSFAKIVGESKSVDNDLVQRWLSNEWPELKARYQCKDIFNGDETGLFYKSMPNKTYKFKGERCSGGKLSKDRLTIYLCASMTGEKRKPLIIGKFAKPRCFKGHDLANFNYTNNKKAWMTSDIFSSELFNWNKELQKKNRKILLLLDNCTAHPNINDKLSNIEMAFLPSNTTSILQPLDQGVIYNFKLQYKKSLVSEVIRVMDSGNALDITILEAIRWIERAWYNVSHKTIINCFLHAGMVYDTKAPENKLIENMSKEDELIQIGIFSNIDEVNQFLELDKDVAVMDTGEVTCEEDVDENKATPSVDIDLWQNIQVTSKEAMTNLKVVLRFLSNKDFYGSTNIKSTMLRIEELVEKDILQSRLTQGTLLDYFNK